MLLLLETELMFENFKTPCEAKCVCQEKELCLCCKRKEKEATNVTERVFKSDASRKDLTLTVPCVLIRAL